MGQPTEQSRDDFKDVQEVEVLSYKNFQKKFCGEAFFEMSSFEILISCSLSGAYSGICPWGGEE